MRWSTYLSPTDHAPHVGLVLDGSIYGVTDPIALVDLLADPDAMAAAAQRAVEDPLDVLEWTLPRCSHRYPYRRPYGISLPSNSTF